MKTNEKIWLKLATTLVLPITLVALVCALTNFNPFSFGWEWLKGFGEMSKAATSQDLVLWIALSGIMFYAISKRVGVNLINSFWVALAVSAALNWILMLIALILQDQFVFLHLVFVAGLSGMFVLTGYKWNSPTEGLMGLPVILSVTIIAFRGWETGVFSFLMLMLLASLVTFARSGIKKYVAYLKK